MWYILTFIGGSLFGIFLMCLIQINTADSWADLVPGTESDEDDFDERI